MTKQLSTNVFDAFTYNTNIYSTINHRNLYIISNIIQIKTLCQKVVYNALIHHYLNYAIMNWGRTSKTAIQPLVNLQNKAVKFLKTSNKATLDEM